MPPIEANGYTIYFGNESYEALNAFLSKRNYSGIFVLTDTNAHELCVARVLSELAVEIPIEVIEIEPGESFKNIETCTGVWEALTDLGADRRSLVLNIGGGVVTDLGGFVAATFKRGIDFINIPTTLLAMVDASVGGKNGVDLGHLKNQIGLVCNPELILIDAAFLETLPQNQLRSGLAEMLKHGLIADANYWQQFLDLAAIDMTDLEALIYRSVQIKNEIVMQDPTENGIRKALNFGHTLGHAIETHFLEQPDTTPLLHGEAIAIGMVLEAYISWQKGLLRPTDYEQIREVLIGLFGLVPFTPEDTDAIIALLIHDKKNEFGKVQFALLDGIGQIKINQESENQLIKEAFADYLS